MPTKAFLQPSSDTAMLFAPFWCTHPPPLSHPFCSLVTKTLHTCAQEGLVTQVQILGPASEFESIQWSGSERIYVLPCESSSFTILWLSVCCVLSGPFATAGSQAYTHTVLVAVVGMYTFESSRDSQSRHRTSKHHWRACKSSTLYAVSTSNPTDGTTNTTFS